MSKSILNEVSDELDELSIKMLDLMSNYIDIKMTLEDVIKTGSLHLAKSRYIMGNRSVSVLQLPTEDVELAATTRVASDDNDLSFQIEKITISGAKESDKIGVKRRKNVQDDSEKDEDKENEETEKKLKNVSQDPLKWFGVLVPQNMRHAQQNFNRAIELSVDCVNLQLEMNAVREKYRAAWERKKQLKES